MDSFHKNYKNYVILKKQHQNNLRKESRETKFHTHYIRSQLLSAVNEE